MGSRRISVLAIPLLLFFSACKPGTGTGSLPKRGMFSEECREGGASHGNAQKCGLFKGFFSNAGAKLGGKNIPGLNWSATQARINGLPSRSGGMCAKGVRLSLGRLFGGQWGGQPAAACQYTLSTFNRLWPKTSSGTRVTWTQTAGSVYPGCVNICKRRGRACGGSKGSAGHAELYSAGGWSSDFNQRGSVCAGSNYEGTRTYCPRQAGGIAMVPKNLQKLMATFLGLSLLHAGDIEEGHAVETKKAGLVQVIKGKKKDKKEEKKKADAPNEVINVDVDAFELEPIGGYVFRTFEDPANGMDTFVITQIKKNEKGEEVKEEVIYDQSNAFSAIAAKDAKNKHIISDPKVRDEMALKYVLKLIEKQGLATVVENIKGKTQLTTFQQNAYVAAAKIHPSIVVPNATNIGAD